MCYRLPMRISIFLSTCLILTSCSKKEAEQPPSATTPAEASSDVEEPDPSALTDAPTISNAAEWGEPGIELVAQGKEPRRQLRLSFEEGLEQSVDVKVGGGPSAPAPGVPARIDAGFALNLRAKKVSGKGSKATAELVIRGFQASPTAGDLAKATQELQGIRGRYVVDSLGRVLEVAFEVPPNADDATPRMINSIQNALLTLSVPLPAEEVGEGGQWTHVQMIEEPAGEVLQRTVYEITKIDASKVHVDLRIEQTSTGPNLEGLVKYLGVVGKGTGTAILDLSKIVPDTARREMLRWSRHVNMTNKQTMDTSLEFTTELGAR